MSTFYSLFRDYKLEPTTTNSKVYNDLDLPDSELDLPDLPG
jgi:hypothetical protein